MHSVTDSATPNRSLFRVLFLLVAVAMVTTMCSIKKPNNETIQTEVTLIPKTFELVYDTLPPLAIPITLTWQTWDEIYMHHIERYGTRPGDLAIDHPIAKLVLNKSFKAFVFGSPDETGAPVIITFDKNGNQLDDLGLLGDVASNDPENRTREQAHISEDLTIRLIDSVWRYQLDDAGARIDNSGVLTVTSETYKLLESGKFEKVKQRIKP